MTPGCGPAAQDRTAALPSPVAVAAAGVPSLGPTASVVFLRMAALTPIQSCAVICAVVLAEMVTLRLWTPRRDAGGGGAGGG